MALSAFQVWQHRRRGKRYCQAWIMRDNTIIATVNEPFDVDKFDWEDKTFIRKKDEDLIWGDRDVFIYEHDNALGKVMTVKDAFGMLQNEAKALGEDEKDVVIGVKSTVDPAWVTESLGRNIVNEAIGIMSERSHSVDIMAILMGVLVLIIVLYVFLG